MLTTKAEVEEYVASRMENMKVDEHDNRTLEEIEEHIRRRQIHNNYMRPIIKALAYNCSGDYDELFRNKHRQMFYEFYEANLDNTVIITAILALKEKYVAQGKSCEDDGQLLVRKNENGEYEEFQPLIAKYDDDYDANLVDMIKQIVVKDTKE